MWRDIDEAESAPRDEPAVRSSRTASAVGQSGAPAQPARSDSHAARDGNDAYISDELMYQLYDGSGQSGMRKRQRQQQKQNRVPWSSAAADGGSDDNASGGGDEGGDEARHNGAPRRRHPIIRYLSCLWPPESAEEKARLDQSEWGQKNWFMRLLLKECWTDGSLMGLKTDIFSGITLAVAQVAPSIAFALMAGAPPLVGLFSSFWLGIIPCVFGGRPGQITAIAGAVVVLYPDLVKKHGVDAAYAVCLIAGCFVLLPGIFRVAGLVRLLPASLMVGFCNGLAISMVQHQIPSFRDEHGDYVTGLRAFYTAIICIVSYAVMMLMPYFTTVVPSAFMAIVVGTLFQYIFQLKTVTIGDLYELHGTFPAPRVPSIDWTDSGVVSPVMVAAILTAIISCVESFMSDYKIQQLTETPTNFERESISLGVAHIVNGFFQGMAGCVVFGPCILNIECGSGTRRLSGFICAVFMVIIPLALFAVIRIIPMAALSAVLFGVSSKTADWRMLAMIFLQRISFQESAVALVVTIVTVIQNLAIGAACGFAAALLFFMWNMSRGKIYITPVMSEEGGATTTTDAAPSSEAEVCHLPDTAPAASCASPFSPRSPSLRPQQQRFMEVNVLNVEVDPVFPDIKVLRVHLRGVLFFGSCMEFVDSMIKLLRDCHEHIFLKVTDLILDFQHGRMPVMDFSAAEAIFDAANTLARRGIRTHVQNMDPLSYTLFERSRRYFPLVLDDNINNCKHRCFFRRVFRVQSTHETQSTAAPEHDAITLPEPLTHGPMADDGSELRVNTSFVRQHTGDNMAGHGRGDAGGNHLEDDVFLRANRSFTRSYAEVAVARRASHAHHHFDPITKPDHPSDVAQLGTVANTATDPLTPRDGGARDDDDDSSGPDERRHATHQHGGKRRRNSAGAETTAAADDVVVAVVPTAAAKQIRDGEDAKVDGGAAPLSHLLGDDNHSQVHHAATSSAPTPTISRSFHSSSSLGDGDGEDIVVVRLVATEEQMPLEESIKVGLPVFRPHFGITVPVFATVESWTKQLEAEEEAHLVCLNRSPPRREGGEEVRAREEAGHTSTMASEGVDATQCELDDAVVHELDRGILTDRKPFNRQYGDFFFTKVWWRRLLRRDIPPTVSVADEAQLVQTRKQNAETMRRVQQAHAAQVRVHEPEELQEGGVDNGEAAAAAPGRSFFLRARTAPTEFDKVPRFPGQGYAKDELLTREEFARMKRIVSRRLFQHSPPHELACFPARMKKFEVDLMDGFI